MTSTRLPLCALLSHALVAYTIEFDNAAELELQHRTTMGKRSGGKQDGPWLVSLAMYANCMQWLADGGLSARELVNRARTITNFDGVRRWGYVTIEPPEIMGGKPPPRSAWIVRLTPKGVAAAKVWEPLFDEIERRWQARFGNRQIDRLRDALTAVVDRIALDLPECLPILGPGLATTTTKMRWKERSPADRGSPADHGGPLDRTAGRLSVLISRALLQMAIDFETAARLSIALYADLVRLLDKEPRFIRDPAASTGVSNEAIAMGLGFLQRRGLAMVERDAGPKGIKSVRLTEPGQAAKRNCGRIFDGLEDDWRARFGETAIDELRAALEAIVSDPSDPTALIWTGMMPQPGNWRARAKRPASLPWFPMILHRGGYPDGS